MSTYATRRHRAPVALANALLAGVVLLAACTSDDSPTAPSAPVAGPALDFVIQDAVHGGGAAGFYFLPPMVPKPALTAGTVFDTDLAGLDPMLRMYRLNANGTQTLLTTLSRQTSPAITFDKKAPQYTVGWLTPRIFGNYRIVAEAGVAGFRRVLGLADVKIVATAKEAKAATNDQQIGEVAGRTLTISFRIETRIGGAVALAPATATIVEGATQTFTAEVRDLHGAVLTGKAVVWSTSDAAVATVDATGLATGVGAGEAIVTGASDGLSGQATLSVTPLNTTVDLGHLGGGKSEARGINAGEQVVGISTTTTGNTNYRAFVWQEGEMSALPMLGGIFSTATSINDAGQIAGTSATGTTAENGNAEAVAVVWEPDGSVTQLAGLGGSGSLATDINELGWAVGLSFIPGDAARHAMLWQNGEALDLGTVDGNPGESEATGINDPGQVVGYSYSDPADAHGFVWENGVMTDLGNLGGSESFSDTEPQDINNSGQIVGYSFTGSATHAFLWEDGEMTDLGTLGGSYSIAYAINEAGQIAGVSATENNVGHAVIWQPDGTITDLGSLPDWNWSRGSAINGDGTVVGYSSRTEDTDHHATLWPVSTAP